MASVSLRPTGAWPSSIWHIPARQFARDVSGSTLIFVDNLGHKSNFVKNDLVIVAIEKVLGRRVDFRAAKRLLEQRIAYDGKN